MIDKIKKFLHDLKNKKKKRAVKDYEYSESKKNEQLFKLITKYVIILILIAFFIILIVAFFKVFIFSKEITRHPKRNTIEKTVKGVNFGVSSQFEWKDLITQKTNRNEKNIQEIKKDIKNLSAEKINSDISMKKFIVETNKKLFRKIDNSIAGTKNEIYDYVNQNNERLKQEILKIKQDNNISKKTKKLNGTFMSIPTEVAKIKKTTTKIINGIMLDKNEVSKKKKIKKTTKEKKKLRDDTDKRIYTSVNIETINTSSSDFDISNNESNNESNSSLPPVILRQGMTNGVLVTGISAPTFSSKDQAAPVLITFKGKSIISNMFEQDVENCTATGSVFGNIITRRGEILINKISCTYKKDGQMYMVRSNVKGWVYDGYDGRLGVPGILVDSSGSIINDSVIIGLLQGFGKFLSSTAGIYAQQGSNSAIGANGTTQYSPASIAKTSLVGGVGTQLSSGFDTITGYYQKIINSLYPYIDIKGGRKISIFFDGGEVLTPKKYTPFLVNENHDSNNKDDNEENNLDNMDREVSIDEW